MTNIYFIGGSPCSGKSTVAEILAEKYDLYYFKVDDFLEEYTKMGAAKGCEICKKQEEMSHGGADGGKSCILLWLERN